MRRFASLSTLGVLVLCLNLTAAEESKLKCPVSGQPAKMDKIAMHNGGKVYFCCENCPKAFAKDTAKFASKANAQLVESGQFVQKVCPLSKQKVNAEKTAEVAGVKVAFCCENCQGKVEAAEGDKKLAMVFADETFKKSFVKKDAKKDGAKKKKSKKDDA